MQNQIDISHDTLYHYHIWTYDHGPQHMAGHHLGYLIKLSLLGVYSIFKHTQISCMSYIQLLIICNVHIYIYNIYMCIYIYGIHIYICLYIHKNIRFTVYAQQQRYFNVKLKHMGVSEKIGNLIIVPWNNHQFNKETYNGIWLTSRFWYPIFSNVQKPVSSAYTGWSIEFPMQLMHGDNPQYVG
jgi:hypothetical protein